MKTEKRFLFIAVILIILSLTLFACDDEEWDRGFKMDYPYVELYTVSDSGEISDAKGSVVEIDIKWINGEVNFTIDENATAISFYEIAEGEELIEKTTLHYLHLSNKLRLNYATSGGIKLGNLRKNLYITLPANLRLYIIDIETISANINVTGDVARLRINSVSGDVTVNGKVRNIDVSTVSGSTDIVCDAALEKLNGYSTSGNVRLHIPEDKGFTMQYVTLSGNLYNAFSSKIEMWDDKYLYLGGGAEIKVDTISGSLTIE